VTEVRPLLIVGAVVVVVAAVVVVAGPWHDGSADRCDIPDRVSGRSGAPAAGPGGGVRVAEQGFTQDANGNVSVGAVLENRSGRVAYRTEVTFRLFDAAHAELPGAAELTTEIPVLLPGQRIGAGTGVVRSTSRVASVEVDPGTTTWLSTAAVGVYSPVTTAHVVTKRFNPALPATVDIHYRETSSNCRPLVNRTTAVVFRNASGAVVGGSRAAPDVPIVFRDAHGKDLGGDWRRPASPSCSPGERETWIVPPSGQPATAADARTETYPYCDLSGPAETGQ
jgi:hypothetical protein